MTLMLLLLSGRAEAQEDRTRVELVWEALPPCLRASDLAMAVDQSVRINHVVPAEGVARVTVSVIRKAERGYEIRFVVVDADNRTLGERQLVFTSDDCSSLGDHLILLTSMLVDSAHLGKPDETGSKSQRAAEDAQNPLWRTTLREMKPRPHRLALVIGARVDYQRLPRPAIGGSLTLLARLLPSLAISIDVFAFPESTLTLDNSRGASRFRWRGLSARACHLGLVSPLEVCVGVRGSEMRATGFDFGRNQVQHEYLLDAEVGAAFQQHLFGPFYIRAELAGFVGLRRPLFVYESETMAVQVLHAPGIVSFLGQVALGFHFL